MKKIVFLIVLLFSFQPYWLFGKNNRIKENKDGASYRIWFDQHNRVQMSWGLNYEYLNSDRYYSTWEYLSFSVTKSWKVTGELGDFWKKEQIIADFQVNPGLKSNTGWPKIYGTLFQGKYIQYQKASYLTIGSTRLPLPFHFGFSLDLGGLYVPAGSEKSQWNFTVIDSRILLDFWRSKKLEKSFTFGLGVYYDIVLRNGNLTDDYTEHLIAPFTALKIKVNHTTKNSLNKVCAFVDWIPVWSSYQKQWGFYFKAGFKIERILLAINDEPLSFFLQAYYRTYQLFSGQDKSSEYWCNIGLTFSYQLE